MFVRLAVLTAVMLLMLSGTVQAAGLGYYGIEATIDEDALVLNDIIMKFEVPIDSLDYQLDFKAFDLVYQGSGTCELVDQGKRSKVLCQFGTNITEVRFGFKTEEAIENSEFSVLYKVPLDVEQVFVQVKLPEKGVLAEDMANQSYSPADGKIMTDGKHIIVYWEVPGLEKGDDLYLSVKYSMPEVEESGPNHLLTAMTVVSVLVAIGAGLYIVRDGKSRPLTSVLNEDEKKVIELLSARGGQAGQKVLVRETDFSKAKVSRLVKSLKARGVVDTEPVSGRENKIILKFKSE